MKLTIPPRAPEKRKEFYYDKLTRTGDKLQELMADRESSLDSLFAEFDRNVKASRKTINFAADVMSHKEMEEWDTIKTKVSHA